jgi:hypothetical protein
MKTPRNESTSQAQNAAESTLSEVDGSGTSAGTARPHTAVHPANSSPPALDPRPGACTELREPRFAELNAATETDDAKATASRRAGRKAHPRKRQTGK